MYRKLFLILVLGTILVCTGCGEDSADKQTSTQKGIQSEAEDTENDLSSTQPVITVQDITVNKDTKSMQVMAEYSGGNKDDLELYSISNAYLDMQVKEASKGLQIVWSGFYEEDTAYENLDIRKGFASATEQAEPVEYVSAYGEVTFIDCVKFEVTAGKGTATVGITPFTVTIQPAEGWREDGVVYHVLAVMKNGNYLDVTQLPSIDDRKRTEKRDNSLTKVKLSDGTELETDSLEMLGMASVGGVVLENDGYRYAVTETIPVDEIEKIEIVPYIFE